MWMCVCTCAYVSRRCIEPTKQRAAPIPLLRRGMVGLAPQKRSKPSANWNMKHWVLSSSKCQCSMEDFLATLLSSALSNRENDFLLKQVGTSLSWEIPKNAAKKTQTFKCFVKISEKLFSLQRRWGMGFRCLRH